MKVFVSWSGQKSRVIASAFKEWLPDLVQSVDVFMSQHDIDAGSRWGNELGAQLQDCNFGIICITSDNIAAPWLLYEAGSLGKSIEQSRVVPFRIGIAATDVPFPLAQFQNVNADKEGTLKLLLSINAVNSQKLEPERLNRLFEKLWPDFELRISEAAKVTESAPLKRPERDLLEEILQITRSIDRDMKRVPEAAKPSPEATPVNTPGDTVVDKSSTKGSPVKADATPQSTDSPPDETK